MQKLTVSRPIIVEGKYDKITLLSVLDATVLTTDGFGLFRQKEKTALLRRLAGDLGVIVFTDPDGGGRQIRSFLSGILPKEKVVHLYAPRIEGKERRKKKGGKAGTLGVEGLDPELLRSLFLPFANDAPQKKTGGITKADLYRDGLSGREGSEAKRRLFSLHLSFPPDMTANALLAAMNLLYTPEEYEKLLSECFSDESQKL